MIRPFPKAQQKRMNRKKKISRILTESLEKDALETKYEEKRRKIAAINIKRNLNKATKQKKIQGERSDEDEVHEKELCQEPRESDVEFDVGDESSEIKLGDFVVTKKNIKHFVGRAKKILSGDEYSVTF
ncbi:hypothetical protein ILUMI_24033 [Ignelater luminosus]|uniref:Uncharacterized protein n=1 Tax=Ignelater luminosus TaxID=2038154 RepID=A0A8K0CBD1_IGNLU|nr:hypothetical protein ILUMI_24033 [Ignelater luminosus]